MSILILQIGLLALLLFLSSVFSGSETALFSLKTYQIRKLRSKPSKNSITVAALLPDDWNVRLIDMNVERLTDIDIAWADIVFITGMIIQRVSLQAVCRRCHYHGVPVVAGGPFVSSSPDAPELERASALFIGEAEDPAAMSNLVEDIRSGRLKDR